MDVMCCDESARFARNLHGILMPQMVLLFFEQKTAKCRRTYGRIARALTNIQFVCHKAKKKTRSTIQMESIFFFSFEVSESPFAQKWWLNVYSIAI